MGLRSGELAINRVRQFWSADHPVLKILHERRQGARLGVQYSDGHRVGLAVEGGGMRGIISGAMLCAIEELGFASCFDAIYGFSAGAMNAAYSFAGDCWYPLSIYYMELADRAFIDFRRMLRGRSFLDMDYLFKEIVGLRRPLSYEAILGSPVELHISVSDVDALESECVSAYSSRDDLIETLHASSWMPITSFHTAMWRGRRAMDGGVLTAHPIRLAVEDSCSHVLSLSTRPIRKSGYRGSPLAYGLGALHLERIRGGLGAKYLEVMAEYWRQRSAMHAERLSPSTHPYILDLAPLPWMEQIAYRELDPARLRPAARDAYRVAYSVLTGCDHVAANKTNAVELKLVPLGHISQ